MNERPSIMQRIFDLDAAETRINAAEIEYFSILVTLTLADEPIQNGWGIQFSCFQISALERLIAFATCTQQTRAV